MAIQEGDSVTISFIGRLDDGTIFDTTNEALAEAEGLAEESPDRDFQPLKLTIGNGRVIEGLEAELKGMEAGDQKTLRIPPDMAYGEYKEDRVVGYDRDEFEEMIGDLELREGFEVETEDGLPGRVIDIGPEVVTVDFNHELAGELLEFEIEILSVD
jgi:FKBP-type peptidyl-prolyl cis-trans isomerase 2